MHTHVIYGFSFLSEHHNTLTGMFSKHTIYTNHYSCLKNDEQCSARS